MSGRLIFGDDLATLSELPLPPTLVTVIVLTVGRRSRGAPAKPAAEAHPGRAASPSAVRRPAGVGPAAACGGAPHALELSGLAWAPSLDRYLAVVDEGIEVGPQSDGPRSCSRWIDSGVIDAEPVPIVEGGALDDVEALTPGPDGRSSC